ncbi:MAG: RNA-binding S4 domain-containing protein [Verrucomicrobia bacterium]|nr:RNA-binding S4 domain-containing protein [Verrucomicrobiota bacterium]
MSAEAAGQPRIVPVRSVPIELSQFLKFAGLVESGGEAKAAIHAGKVRLNGAVESQKGRKLQVGDQVSYGGETIVVQLG